MGTIGAATLVHPGSADPAPPERPPEEPESAIIERAQLDPGAFGPIYDRYFDPVYRYCYRRLGHSDDAADATSLVFARTLAALPRYRSREEGSFRSWLFTIAHNVVTDGFRLRDRRPEAPLIAAGHVADTTRDGAPEETAIAAEARRSLLAALALLPHDQRRIVELRLAGLTGPEIAAVLDRSVGAVKIGQHRAYARLRDILAPDRAAELGPAGGAA